jgi:hypothetical protein
MPKNWGHIQRTKGHRSGLEDKVSEELKQIGIDGEYEKHQISYTKPATNHTYKPDFRLPNGIFIETKGRFTLEDRKKHLLIKAQKPDLDIRIVFQNPNAKLNKRSKTTYGMWADKNGFKWATKQVPVEWVNEEPKTFLFG